MTRKSRTYPKSKSAETAHHDKYDESMESKLCKLHARVLCVGKIPDKYFSIYEKSQRNASSLKNKERADLELFDKYTQVYGLPKTHKNGKEMKWLTLWKMKAIHAFCLFIDDPKRCHKGRLMGLHQCKSSMKTLQFKQRVELVKVVTTLFTLMNVDGCRIGRYADKRKKQTPLYDENGHELLRAVTHSEIRDQHEFIWSSAITKTKYTDVINMLKLAGFFEVESCYVGNVEGEVIRHEMRLNGATAEEIGEIPRIKSVAAYKWFKESFINALLGVVPESTREMLRTSLDVAKADMAKKKLSSMYATHSASSAGFWTKKRKEFLQLLGLTRYPQGAPPAPNPYGDTLPELDYGWG
ncbi:hypothetical protein [Vibrio scophthalmi]|uniref:Uncharacterized protein n=1 Tax=Vibrio scophthalmi TaxID=45658 RepID=A0A1E3WJ00_9VIBR|nr:hypothetical protein [Vibrio scophthalmi]ODS09743.1 hypothetical protein VSF3289_03205 [Vibrio scophthalmi]